LTGGQIGVDNAIDRDAAPSATGRLLRARGALTRGANRLKRALHSTKRIVRQAIAIMRADRAFCRKAAALSDESDEIGIQLRRPLWSMEN